MIREYAIDPQVICSDINVLQRFFSEFGAEKGRIIGAVPNRWKDYMQRLVQELIKQPIARRNCLDKLRKLENYSVVTRDGMGLGQMSWIDKASLLNQESSFSAILSNVEDRPRNKFDYLNFLEHVPDNWEIEQTISVARSTANLANAIKTSLEFAKVAIFADPHFKPEAPRFTDPLIAFIDNLRGGRIRCNKAFLHLCINLNAIPLRTRNSIEVLLVDNLQPLLPTGFVLEVWVWPPNAFHDRFVITNNVGYSFGHGLDEAGYQSAINVNINRLGEQARKEQRRNFSREADRLGSEIVLTGV